MTVKQGWPRTVVAPPDHVPEFGEALSEDLADTVSNLLALQETPERHFVPTNLTLQQQMLFAQTEEIKELRKQLAAVTTAVMYKASKKALAEIETNVNAKLDKRLDAIRNWALGTIALLGALFSVFGALGLLKH